MCKCVPLVEGLMGNNEVDNGRDDKYWLCESPVSLDRDLIILLEYAMGKLRVLMSILAGKWIQMKGHCVTSVLI